jgi:hypothetical protein
MFNLSSLSGTIDFAQEEITSVTLSWHVINAYGSPVVTVTHGTKATPGLVYNSTTGDTPSSATFLNDTWTENLGNASGTGGQTVALGVTAAFLADLKAGNTYSSYRLVQADTYVGPAISQGPYGAYIASSENTSGYLVPTLTITTKAVPAPAVPEPARVGALLGAGALFAVLAARRRRSS